MYAINILLIEDDQRIREIIRTYTTKEQYQLFEAGSGKEADELMELNEYHLIILDVMLPDTDGWTILRKLRKTSQIPVIMLTARAEEDDKLFGFGLGADDYLTKPFSAKELMARIKSLLKRNRIVSANELIEIGYITVNRSYHEVLINGNTIELTPLEYSLLMYFVDNKNVVLTRTQILNGVWGYDYFGDERTVDTHVKRLRKKINDPGEMIKTVRGSGYRLVV